MTQTLHASWENAIRAAYLLARQTNNINPVLPSESTRTDARTLAQRALCRMCSSTTPPYLTPTEMSGAWNTATTPKVIFSTTFTGLTTTTVPTTLDNKFSVSNTGKGSDEGTLSSTKVMSIGVALVQESPTPTPTPTYSAAIVVTMTS